MGIRGNAILLLFLCLWAFAEPVYAQKDQDKPSEACAKVLERCGISFKTYKEILADLIHRLTASSKTKKLHLPNSFSDHVLRHVLSDERWQKHSDFLRSLITNAAEVDKLELDKNRIHLVAEVVHKWATEKLETFQISAKPPVRSLRAVPQPNIPVLDDYQFDLWLARRGDHAGRSVVMAAVHIDEINRTQPVVSAVMKNLEGIEVPLQDTIRHMRHFGDFHKKGAPDVVPVLDPLVRGRFRFATLGHRRLVCAREAGLKKVWVKVHRPESRIPNEKISNSLSVDLTFQGGSLDFEDPLTGETKHVEGVFRPTTWGEAIVCVCANTRRMRKLAEWQFPNTGLPGLPPLPRS